MRVLLQNCYTGLFLRSLSEWTSDPEEALDFQSSAAAIHFCAQNGIPEVQVVLELGTREYNVAVPITEECREQARSG